MSAPTNHWKLGAFVVASTLIGLAAAALITARTMQVVTVTYTSLCGNGTLDSSVGEQCDAGAGNGEGQRGGGWSHDTFCITAGPNGQYETPFGGNATHGVYRRGDDLIFVISGDTR